MRSIMRPLSAKLSLLVLAMLVLAVAAGNSMAAKDLLEQLFHGQHPVVISCFCSVLQGHRAERVVMAARAIYPKKNTTATGVSTTRSTTTRPSLEKKKLRNLTNCPKKRLEGGLGELAAAARECSTEIDGRGSFDYSLVLYCVHVATLWTKSTRMTMDP